MARSVPYAGQARVRAPPDALLASQGGDMLSKKPLAQVLLERIRDEHDGEISWSDAVLLYQDLQQARFGRRSSAQHIAMGLGRILRNFCDRPTRGKYKL